MKKKLSDERIQELFSDVKQKVQTCKNFLMDRKDAWLERMAFYRGYHYSVSDGAFFVDADEPIGEAMETHNYIPAFVRSSVSYRIKNFPNPSVSASSTDHLSITKAKAAEKLVRSFVDDDVVSREEIVRATFAAQILGGAYIKCYWDPDAGKPTLEEVETEDEISVDEETGEQTIISKEVVDEFGEPILSRQMEGKIKVEYVSLMDGILDPAAKRLCDARYFVHRKRIPVETLKQMFEKDYFGNKPMFDYGQDFKDSEWEEVNGQQDDRNEEVERLGEIIEYWQTATKEQPNGMLFVFSGNTILHIGPNPYKPCRLPVLLMLGDKITSDGLLSDGVVEDLIPLQKTLNRVESKIREWVDKIITPHILNPMGSGVDSDLFGELIGQVIDHAPGLKPEIMPVPNIPGSMFDASRVVVDRMKEISTYTDISRGDVPPGVTTGRAMAFAKENEQSLKEPDMIIYRRNCLDILMHCFWLAKQFYSDGRLIRTLGDEGWEYFVFNDDDFDWYIDLVPEAFSGAPNSRALRWSETMEAFSSGLFNDDLPGSKNVRRMLEMDSADRSTVDPKAQHRTLARMEIMQFIRKGKGEMMEVNPVREFHDDEIHLDEHNRFRNSLEYLELPPDIQQEVDAHCEEHEKNLQGKMNVFSQNAQMSGNIDGPPPPKAPGLESPPDGGHSVGEAQPESQDEYLTRQMGFPPTGTIQ